MNCYKLVVTSKYSCFLVTPRIVLVKFQLAQNHGVKHTSGKQAGVTQTNSKHKKLLKLVEKNNFFYRHTLSRSPTFVR